MFWSISLINQSFISCMLALVVTICIERLIKCTLCSLSAVIQCYLWNLELHFFGLSKCFYASGFLLAQKTNFFFGGGGSVQSTRENFMLLFSTHCTVFNVPAMKCSDWKGKDDQLWCPKCKCVYVQICMSVCVCFCCCAVFLLKLLLHAHGHLYNILCKNIAHVR